MDCKWILKQYVMPKLLEDDRFKEALSEITSEVQITNLEDLESVLPDGKKLSVSTIKEAGDNYRANLITGITKLLNITNY